MMGLAGGHRISTKCLAVLIRSARVTHSQTDGNAIAYTGANIASRGKKHSFRLCDVGTARTVGGLVLTGSFWGWEWDRRACDRGRRWRIFSSWTNSTTRSCWYPTARSTAQSTASHDWLLLQHAVCSI